MSADGESRLLLSDGDEWLSPGEASRRLGISTRYLAELAESGKVPFVRTPLGRLYPAGAVDRIAFERARRAK